MLLLGSTAKCHIGVSMHAAPGGSANPCKSISAKHSSEPSIDLEMLWVHRLDTTEDN